MLRLLKYGLVIAAIYTASPLRDPGDRLSTDATRLGDQAADMAALAKAASDHPEIMRRIAGEALGATRSITRP